MRKAVTASLLQTTAIILMRANVIDPITPANQILRHQRLGSIRRAD